MQAAYSYIRFSTRAQSAGDSERRQTEAAESWCRRNGVALDKTTTLRDLGKSAFLGTHRTNADRYALAAFLKLVEAGKVPRGSALIVESLDRLSREHIRPALTLLLNLIEAGIRVVQLIPVETVYDEAVEPMALMMAIMELSRGHSESAVKSERIGAAWAKKRERARGGEILTRQLPAWVVEKGGTLALDPLKAAAVRRIFELSEDGRGLSLIVQKLISEGVKPLAGPKWARSYVAKILRDRRAVGELQLRLTDGTPDGPPMPTYYPAVATEAQFLATRAGVATRKRIRGRNGKNVNLFAGLLTDAKSGAPFYFLTKTNKSKRDGSPIRTSLLSTAESNSGAGVSVRYGVFENLILQRLREIDPKEIVGESEAGAESAALSGELADLDSQIGKLERELETAGEVSAAVRVLGRLETRRREVAEKLADARQRAANPAGEAFGEVQSLAALVATADEPDEVRLKLRSVLRRVVDTMRLLVVVRGVWRLGVVQVDFQGGTTRRVYAFACCYHRVDKPPVIKVLSGAWASAAGAIDLRVSAGAARVEKLLLAIDPDKLA